MMRTAAIAIGASLAATAASAVLLGGWFLLGAGAAVSADCTPTAPLDDKTIPTELVPLFQGAAGRYHLGAEGPSILAGLTKVESDFGRNRSTSSAGAVGWTQFMPETWASFGVDANGDGRRDPQNAVDAIYSAANYLSHLGAPRNWHDALFGYNHAEWYVQKVLDTARGLSAQRGSAPVGATCSFSLAAPIIGRPHRVYGGGRLVPIPGSPGQTIDERIVYDLAALARRYHFVVTAGYDLTGHAANGEHPLGLAADIVPGPGGTWDDIDALAKFAEPQQNAPRAPWRWVGYDGDENHGRGNHLHLSWLHSPAAPGARPVAWVEVLGARP